MILQVITIFYLKNRCDNNNPYSLHVENFYTTFICLGAGAPTCLKLIVANIYMDYESEFMDYVRQLNIQIRKTCSKYHFANISSATNSFEIPLILLMHSTPDNKCYIPAIMT